MNSKVFVIIVSYNAMKWVDRCFGSLRKSRVTVFPVLIDNCSKDETVEYVRSNFPEVHLIVNKENRGFGQANNQGIEWAYRQGATHFFLLNQDAWIRPDTVERLIDVQDQNNIALVSPIHLNGTGDKIDYGFFSLTVLVEKNIDYVSDLSQNNIKPFYNVSKINAAAWMLSRRTIETVGGFDPIFFIYGEDGNYCQRLKFHGGQIAFVPNSFIHHDRKLHGNSKEYNKREVLMQLLYMYADVNRSCFDNIKGQMVLHLWLLKRAFCSLIKFKFINFWIIVQGYYLFFVKIPQIGYSKSTNKKVNPSWLNIRK